MVVMILHKKLVLRESEVFKISKSIWRSESIGLD